MRRPDKKMVHALTGLQDHRRAMSVSGEKEARVVAIKKEPDEDGDVWKNLPLSSNTNVGIPSPLTRKSGSEDLPFSPPSDLATEDRPSTSSATISALMAAGRKRRESNSQGPRSVRVQGQFVAFGF